jgi:hypothetical protein
LSPPTSSTPTIACCIDTFYPAILRTVTVAESFSTGRSEANARLGSSTLYGRYWQHRRVLSSSTHCWVMQTPTHASVHVA